MRMTILICRVQYVHGKSKAQQRTRSCSCPVQMLAIGEFKVARFFESGLYIAGVADWWKCSTETERTLAAKRWHLPPTRRLTRAAAHTGYALRICRPRSRIVAKREEVLLVTTGPPPMTPQLKRRVVVTWELDLRKTENADAIVDLIRK